MSRGLFERLGSREVQKVRNELGQPLDFAADDLRRFEHIPRWLALFAELGSLQQRQVQLRAVQRISNFVSKPGSEPAGDSKLFRLPSRAPPSRAPPVRSRPTASSTTSSPAWSPANAKFQTSSLGFPRQCECEPSPH